MAGDGASPRRYGCFWLSRQPPERHGPRIQAFPRRRGMRAYIRRVASCSNPLPSATARNFVGVTVMRAWVRWCSQPPHQIRPPAAASERRRRALRQCRALRLPPYSATTRSGSTTVTGGAVLVVEPLGRRWGLWPGAQLRGSSLTAGCPKAAAPGRFRDHLAQALNGASVCENTEFLMDCALPAKCPSAQAAGPCAC
jgi:hypothetical protein